MAGEIQLNSTTMATESSGSITAQLDTIRPNTTNGSLVLQGDSSDAGVTGLTIDSSGNATFAGTANNLGTVTAGTISGGTIGSGVTFPALGNAAVGTVSESSGTPTGDIIERGSNANGEYVKYADGTMICFDSVSGTTDTSTSLITGATVYYIEVTWTFPSAFSGNVRVIATGSDSNGSGACLNSGPSTSSVLVWIYKGSNSNGVQAQLMAIGHWF